MIVLAVETSCDETSIAIIKRVRGKNVRFEILSHKTLSQIDIHKAYGGVYPAMAKREHAKNITQLCAEVLHEADVLVERSNDAPLSQKKKEMIEKLSEHEREMGRALIVLFEGIQKPKIDAIAVTSGPGLEPALWVGINFALALHTIWNIPLYPINHMEGHVIASLLSKKEDFFEIPEIEYPALALLVSGGHTELVRMSKKLKYHIIGQTLDDACGECFDKSARLLGMKYPGGPKISSRAERGRKEGIIVPPHMILPRPMINTKDLSFSFSGLKTAVLTRVKKQKDSTEEGITESFITGLSLELENAITDVLIEKTKQAIFEVSAKTVLLGGGVSANTHIREQMERLTKENKCALYVPEKSLSTDNALMIAATALLHIENGGKSRSKVRAKGRWRIDQPFTYQ